MLLAKFGLEAKLPPRGVRLGAAHFGRSSLVQVPSEGELGKIRLGMITAQRKAAML